MKSPPINDKLLAERLCQWEPDAWDEFVQRFGSRILQVAVKWCGPECRTDCSGYGTAVRRRPRIEIVCGKALDAFDIIVRIIVKRLPAYRGECSLATWLHPVLTPGHTDKTAFNYSKLFSEYLRQVHRRIQVPECLKNTPAQEQKLFLRLAQGQTLEEAGNALGLQSAEALAAQERIADTLKRQSYGLYWQYLGAHDEIRRPISTTSPAYSDNDDDRAIDPGDTRPGPEVEAEAHIYLAVIYQAIRAQSDADRLLLALRYDHVEAVDDGGSSAPMQAAQIAEVFEVFGEATLSSQKTVYGRLRTLRERLVRALASQFDDVAVTEPVMDGILDEWGSGQDGLAAEVLQLFHQRQRESGLSLPS